MNPLQEQLGIKEPNLQDELGIKNPVKEVLGIGKPTNVSEMFYPQPNTTPIKPITPQSFKTFQPAKPITAKPTQPAAPSYNPTTFPDTASVNIPEPTYNPTTFNAPSHAGISNEPYHDPNLTGTGLQLNGSFTPEQQKIADKYAMYYKSPIAINVVSSNKNLSFGAANGNKDKLGGETNYYKNGSREIQVDGSLKDPAYFEFAMLHEIGHDVFHLDEKSADNYALQMMDIINNQK